MSEPFSITQGLIRHVEIQPKNTESFAAVLGQDNLEAVQRLADHLKQSVGDRVIWNVNSTAAGGGVAEMLHTLLSYTRGLKVDTRWVVISGSPDFFRITKRIHNALHGEVGDGSELDQAASQIYERVTAANAAEFAEMVRPNDIVIFHDPQTAGLIPHLVRKGVAAVWRCHIGIDRPCAESDSAWSFLEPYLKHAHAFIFSRFSYLPEILYHGRCLIVPPSIDPFSPKNQDMEPDTALSILTHLNVIDGPNGTPRRFTRSDGSVATVERRAEIVREGPPPREDIPLVVQVSRWDRLKDPVGVLHGFARALDSNRADHAHLMLVGPRVEAISDDPEGAFVFEETVAEWRKLAQDQRRRIHLVNLPMEDLQENAAMVNAIQRHAAIVVQKSLREGFGLTVTEAMWKAKPVIASAVGGIRDQIQHGVSGLLLRDPTDLDAFGGAVTQVLANDGLANRLGRNARRRVSQNYLGLNIISVYDHLIERLQHDVGS